jgi:hypothetical protein
VQAVDFALDVPDRLAQILHCVALLPCAPQVFDGIADAKIVVLGYFDALYPGRVSGIMSGMVYRVFGLLHPTSLPKPAWLSN